MAILQIKRGNASAVAAYTPKVGELVLDTDNNYIYIGDGTTVGGKALAVLASVASSAAKWSTARKITVSGAASGSVTLDGSADVTLTLTQGDVDLGTV